MPHRPTATSRLGAIALSAGLVLASVTALMPLDARAGGETYGLPPPEKIVAQRSEIDTLDAETAVLVDQLKAGSPVAVDYAKRASAMLIFPRVETSTFILGETRALGVLYKKDAEGRWQKGDYYRGERDSLGLQSGSASSSRVVMFLNPETLASFEKGSVSADIKTVDAETGETEGDPEADVAVLVANQAGGVVGLSFRGLKIGKVEFIE